MMHPLQISGISKSFVHIPVLENIDLTIPPSEITGLIGLNGMGKTTLIKIILDLLRSDHGSAKFFGNVITHPQSRKNIAYLPEKFTPSPFLKGWEFLSFIHQFSTSRFQKKAALELATQLKLPHNALDKKIKFYSKGMVQKLGLIATFLTKAPLLILDEPMSGLDPEARICLKSLLLDYKAQGNTIFFSSHILNDVEEICKHIAILHHGKIRYKGCPNILCQEQGKPNLELAFLAHIANI